jgi:hypothetical protein
MPGMLLVRRTIVVLSACAVLLLATAAVSSAAFTFTSPADRSVFNPGTTLRLGYDAACPPGMSCGFKSGVLWQEGVQFNTEYVSAPGGPAYGRGATYLGGAAGQQVATTRLDDAMTAGTWRFKANWRECTGVEGAGTCTYSDAVRTIRVRAIIGTKRSKPVVNVLQDRTSRNRVETQFSFICNATEKNFRFDLILQKQVKRGTRMRWVQVSRRSNQRVDQLSGYSCWSRRAVTMPRSIDSKTKMRLSFAMRSIGIQPAARKRNAFSKPFTRATLSSGGTGGITIGS